MKVSDLIEHLEQFNPDFMVYIAEDSEGNGFAPIQTLLTTESILDGQMVDKDDDFDEDSIQEVVVLWPNA